MKPRISRFVCWALLIATFVWIILAIFDSFGQRRVFHVEGAEFLSDYTTPRACASADDPYRPCVVKDVDACYPALAYAILRIFPECVSSGVVLTLLMTVIYICSLTAISRWKGQPPSALKSWDVALPVVVCAVSAPMLFTMERGNLVILSAAGAIFFCVFYDSASRFLRVVAAFALALAVMLKIAPIVFALLMFIPSGNGREGLSRRCLRFDVSFLLTLFFSLLVLFFVPFLFFGGVPDGIASWLDNAKQNSMEYALATRWGFVALGRAVHHALGNDLHSPWFCYSACRAASIMLGLMCLAVLAYFAVKNRTVAFSQRIFLVASSMLLIFPPMHFYAALYLLPVFVIRVNEWRFSRIDVFEATCWFFILVPLQIPFEASSLNTPLVAMAHLGLVGTAMYNLFFRPQ